MRWHSRDSNNARRRGLTLIQTLVVIGMIIVLLAILVPVVNRAMYQAALARCGTNLKAIAAGANTYAADNVRLYPGLPPLPWSDPQDPMYRPTLEQKVYRPDYLGQGGTADFRRTMSGVIAADALTCPLSPEISLRMEDTAQSLSYANYGLWTGWRYAGERGMRRMAEPWTWRDHQFDVLAGDIDFAYGHTDAADSSHPDDAGWLAPFRRQDEATNEGMSAVTPNMTVSLWTSADSAPHGRGLIDTNFARNDGSVRRYGGVELRDERMAGVPLGSYGEEPEEANRGSYIYVPRH